MRLRIPMCYSVKLEKQLSQATTSKQAQAALMLFHKKTQLNALIISRNAVICLGIIYQNLHSSRWERKAGKAEVETKCYAYDKSRRWSYQSYRGEGINKSFFSTQVVNEIDCSTTRQQQSQGNWRQVAWKSQVLAKQMSINDGGDC